MNYIYAIVGWALSAVVVGLLARINFELFMIGWRVL